MKDYKSRDETFARVSGHTLVRQGWPHNWLRQAALLRIHDGHALCSCGELSPIYFTTAARQRWHRRHKTAVLNRNRTKGHQP